jgi:hypothetical protein
MWLPKNLIMRNWNDLFPNSTFPTKNFRIPHFNSKLWIRIYKAFQVNPDPIWIQGFNDQKLKKKIQLIFLKYLFDQKLQFTYVQATGEAFSPQKRTSSTSRMKFVNFFYVCWSFLPSWIRTGIQGPH